ncbi:MAG: Long-chain-fatty-acid--CoA ligase FadD13 [Pseudomonadales bacterium]|nr:Long-chain-fatty-acid--CoA ligase FadD13 [Pseudomonadales bacterium]
MDPDKQKIDASYARITGPGAPFELVTETIDGRPYRLFRNAPRTLRELYAPAYAHGDKEFVVYEGERWSFARMLALADAIAHQLVHRSRAGKGDRVAIAMRNYPEWMAAYIGITSAGATVVPLNSWGRAQELEYALSDAGAKIVFCDRQRHDYVAPRAAALGLTLVVVRPGNEALPPASLALADYIAGAENAPLPEVAIDPDDIAVIAYTSGTTGNPKGAVSTHRAVCQAITCFECSAMAQAMANHELIAAMMAKGFEPTSLLAVPLFHVSGCYAVFMTSLRAGRRIVIMFKWDVERALELVEQERVTNFTGAPSMLMDLLESPDFDRHDTRSLSAMGAGGAATPPKIGLLMSRRVEGALPGTGWGMTETNALGSSFSGNAFHEHIASAGFVQPVIELSFRDEDGNEMPPGEPGHIWVHSVCLIKEYWNRPDANAKEFRDGWFNSGDIGYLGADGYLYLTDRAKDMVIRGGENIFPLEIEKTLMDAPDVLEAVGFGVPDEQWGEELALVVRLKQPGTLDAAAVRTFLGQRLAAFKVPRYVDFTAEPLPRNATHKVLKKEVRQAFLAAHGML